MTNTKALVTTGSHTVWQIKWFDKNVFKVESFLTTDEATRDKIIAMCQELAWDVTVDAFEVQHWSEV